MVLLRVMLVMVKIRRGLEENKMSSKNDGKSSVDGMNDLKGAEKLLKRLPMDKAVNELYSIKKEVRQVYENQAQIIPALVSVYDALEAIAKHEGVKLPKPHIDMKLE